MTIHMQPPQAWLEAPESLRPWRSQYPKFGELIDAGVSPLKALRCLGLALWQDGHLSEAARVLRTAVASAPDQLQILTDLGSVLCAAGRSAEATHYLMASLELDPRQLHVWINLAGLYHQGKETANAERAYRKALELQPESPEAAVGLGLLYAEQRQFEQAAGLLTAAIASGTTAPAVYACLGQALYQLGDYAGAATALGEAARALPECAPIVRRYAEARLIEMVVGGSVNEAMQAYNALAGPHAEDLDAVCRRAFQTLCVYGPAEATIRVGESMLGRAPDDPVIGYHLDALQGKTHARAPSSYLTACFDGFSEDFEHHLVEVLDYRIPEKAYPLLVETGVRCARILDLGCGTGLAAPYLSKFGGRLVGVDISPRMLEKARARGTYSRLVEDEAISYLANCGEQFDLIAAFDVVVYFGDLAGLFAAVASRLDRGGIFAFSFETGQGNDYSLRASGRFAHAPGYVDRMYAKHFTAIARLSTMLRLEANRPVAGQLLLVRRA